VDIAAGILGGAFLLGFRHGFDIDHLSALGDLTCAQRSSRRSFLLAMLYVAGHAAVVLVIGVVAIAIGLQLPDGIDTAMERVVGLSLIVLGLVTAVSIVRQRGAFRPRSRWTLMAGWVRRSRNRRMAPDPVVITHDHPHDHSHDDRDHHHLDSDHHTLARSSTIPQHSLDDHHERELVESATAGIGDDGVPIDGERHRHLHHHVLSMPADPLPDYGPSGAVGLGAIHGIGAETPTQVLIFAAAAGAHSGATGVAALVAFIVGLVVMHTVLAGGIVVGYARARTNRWLMVGVSGMVAVLSIVIGALYLVGSPPAIG
jgi:cytochrome c biogenesis protein CcdA